MGLRNLTLHCVPSYNSAQAVNMAAPLKYGVVFVLFSEYESISYCHETVVLCGFFQLARFLVNITNHKTTDALF